MLKYELKKLYSNKFVIASLILTAVILFAYAGYTHSLYFDNRYYACESILLNGNAFQPITITEKNIDTLEARVRQLEENHEINDEYHILSYAVQEYRWLEYCTTPDYFADYKGIFVQSAENLPPQESKELQRDLTRLENGLTVGASFGWQELLKTGSTSALPILIFILILSAAACSVCKEHEIGMYPLIISCKNGHKKTVHTKICAVILFAASAAAAFDITALLAYLIFFSPSGALTDSAMVLCGRVLNYMQCFAVMLLFSVISAIAAALTALAVSALCKKSLTAAGINLILFMLTLFFGFFFNFISSNLNGFTDSLPANIPMTDFSTALYREFTKGSEIAGAYNILAPFAPMCLLVSLISIPVIHKGWKKA